MELLPWDVLCLVDWLDVVGGGRFGVEGDDEFRVVMLFFKRWLGSVFESVLCLVYLLKAGVVIAEGKGLVERGGLLGVDREIPAIIMRHLKYYLGWTNCYAVMIKR